ncbi:uncharacterized protein LAJ45_00686 [Morchella importuna]|uniref:uncharacterized protein n=1 Tax=Morchella importuna TaxID=1174673 RepID=UPI001E8DDB79|nr:uncharacterized protein LAJ45_00686 [Morchella importuna]KAH8155676.1 hypothetical protein LAJ45_00686 [Morchella importuna]
MLYHPKDSTCTWFTLVKLVIPIYQHQVPVRTFSAKQLGNKWGKLPVNVGICLDINIALPGHVQLSTFCRGAEGQALASHHLARLAKKGGHYSTYKL